ncbi:MAG TPA: GDSL-type esterase/lipase family protein [Labilithrix sp.]|nr:GDSL-type esterase/lipase family protein [Labilithrix sp.]
MKRSFVLGASVTCGLLAIAACASDATTAHGGPADASSNDGRGIGDPTDAPTSSDGAPIYVDAGPPAVEFIGRFDTRDPAGPKCGWPGCRILARFEGTSVSVELDEIDEDWMDGVPSEWDVALDHVWKDKIVTTPGTKTYPIASGLAAGPHEVELYKRSETQNGITQFRSFDFGGGKLIEPPLRSTRRIEIIGDSAAAGFGVEGIGYPDNDCPGLDYSAQWQNFRKSFGSVLGTTLDAEVHGTVYSGKGMVKNIWRPDPDTMPVIFPLANPVDLTSTYDFAWKPDVVIVMMGGNDFSEGQPDESNGNGPATPSEFTAAYRTFVGTLRGHYPNAHVFLSVSPSVGDVDPPGRLPRTNITNTTITIAKERNDANDSKVYAFAPTVAPPLELTACNGHGTPAFHARVAGEFATVVKQKTGW